MRVSAFALAITLVAFCTSAHAQSNDLNGVWIARELEERRESGGYFSAALSHDAAGRLRGEGVVDPCPRCAGFMQYDVNWQGGVKGGVLVLTGTPSQPYRRGVAIFRGRAVGDRYEGVLTGLHRRQSMHMMLERAESEE